MELAESPLSLRISGRKIPVSDRPTHTFLDRCEAREGGTTLIGWAVNERGGKPATRIVLFQGTEPLEMAFEIPSCVSHSSELALLRTSGVSSPVVVSRRVVAMDTYSLGRPRPCGASDGTPPVYCSLYARAVSCPDAFRRIFATTNGDPSPRWIAIGRTSRGDPRSLEFALERSARRVHSQALRSGP